MNKFLKMIKDYGHTIAERFIRYVQIDTQSDPESNTYPTTEKQKDLSKLLAKELIEIGLQDVQTDEFGYVYATVSSNTKISTCYLFLQPCGHSS